MKIHHIGYLVKNIETALDEFKVLGYEIIKDCQKFDEFHQKVCLIKNGEHLIELICPTDSNASAWSLLKRMGNSPYHICYQVPNLEDAMQSLYKRGYSILQNPFSSPAIESKRCCFLFNNEIGIVELIEIF